MASLKIETRSVKAVVLLGSIVAGLLAAAPLAALQATPQPHAKIQREVAITFDDLPGVHFRGRCNYKALEQLNQKLIRSLTSHRIPAVGFVIEGRRCDERKGALADLLRIWLDAGLELGNHSFSHLDINNTPLVAYQADVIRGEATTRRLLQETGKSIKYFRHPYLHAGKDPETKQALEKFLAERGYQVAPVTIDNQEWVFADVYARTLRRGDHELMQRVGTAYIAYMEDIFEFFEKRSIDVVEYEIKQVLLLHANPLNADYFEELLQMMKSRGYRFIPLERALTDAAYRLPDRYAGPRGLSWLHRWSITKNMKMKEEPREPQWIRQLFEAR